MTNKRKIFLDLFNLNENASIEDIKKRYRELAKEFHPDRNKDLNAHDRFLLIKEAYEFLIIKSYSDKVSTYHENIDLEKERIEKIKLAKEKLKDYYQRKQQKIDKQINDFFKSKIWKCFVILSFLCLIYSIINIVDFFLPKTEKKTIITEISNEYNGFLNEKLILINPNHGKSFFISNKIKQYIKQNDSIRIYNSVLLNKTHFIISTDNINISKLKNMNSNLFFNILISLILILPFIFFKKKKREITYIFVTKIFLTFYTPFIFYLILNT